MDEKDNIGGRVEATEDVEGHALKWRGVDGPDTDDVESHMPHRKVDSPDEADDTEGHMPRRMIDGPDQVDESDDTEGPGISPGVSRLMG